MEEPLLVFATRGELERAVATGTHGGVVLPRELKVLLQAIDAALGSRQQADVSVAGEAFRIL